MAAGYGFTEEEFQTDTQTFLYNFNRTGGEINTNLQNKICNLFIPKVVKSTLEGSTSWQSSRRLLLQLTDYKGDVVIRITAMEGLRDLALSDILSTESARGIDDQRKLLSDKLISSNMTDSDEIYQTRETFAATMSAVYRHVYAGTIVDSTQSFSGLDRVQRGIDSSRVRQVLEYQAIDENAVKICKKHTGLHFSRITELCVLHSVWPQKESKEVMNTLPKMNLLDVYLLILNLANKVHLHPSILHHASVIIDNLFRKKQRYQWAMIHYIFKPLITVAVNERWQKSTRLDAVCCLRKFWEKEELRKTEGYNFAMELLQRQSYPLLLCTDVEEIVSLMTDILIKKNTHYQEDKYSGKIVPCLLDHVYKEDGFILTKERDVYKGKGQYIYQGRMVSCQSSKCAVYVCRVDQSRPAVKEKFFQGMANLRSLNHPCIVRVMSESTRLLSFTTEWASEGRLDHFLLRKLRVWNERFDIHRLDVTKYKAAKQAAEALRYLRERRMVHRQIIPENFLVFGGNSAGDEDFNVKLTNFENAIQLKQREDRYASDGTEKIPVKYAATETILKKIYSCETDMFSYGVLLWVICTLGGDPYFECKPISAVELIEKIVLKNVRVKQRSLVPANVYKQILQCNHSNSRERPGPDDVIACLDKTLRAAISTGRNTHQRVSLPPCGDSDCVNTDFEVISKSARRSLLLKSHPTNVPDFSQRRESILCTEETFLSTDRPIEMHDDDYGDILIETIDKRRNEKIRDIITNFPLHENLLRIEVIRGTKSRIQLVTKRLALGDLKTFLINFKTIKPEEIRDIFLQVVEAVLALRKNHILHNDIRLSNVYVEKEQSDDLIVKLGRFGRACKIYIGDYDTCIDDADVESDIPVMPDAVYWCSPELIMINRQTYSSHVYALAALWWEMYTCLAAPAGTEPLNLIPLGNRTPTQIAQGCHAEELEQPPGCSDGDYVLMKLMWSYHAVYRPSLDDVRSVLINRELLPKMKTSLRKARMSAYVATSDDIAADQLWQVASEESSENLSADSRPENLGATALVRGASIEGANTDESCYQNLPAHWKDKSYDTLTNRSSDSDEYLTIYSHIRKL